MWAFVICQWLDENVCIVSPIAAEWLHGYGCTLCVYGIGAGSWGIQVDGGLFSLSVYVSTEVSHTQESGLKGSIGQVYAFRVRSLYGINPDWLLLRCTLPFCIKFAFFFPGTTMAEQLRVVFCYTETLLFFKVYTSRQKSATVAWLVELNTGRLAVWVPLSPVHTVVPLCKTLTTKMQQNQNKTI